VTDQLREWDRVMSLALDEARRALDVDDSQMIGRGFNQPVSACDPTAHAEIVAIRDAARTVGNYRLSRATLVVTIEPCLMCVGAIVHSRIGTVVFGATEPRTGALLSTTPGRDLPGHNHRFEFHGGVREDECRALIQTFFRNRRGPSGPDRS
jgi:tRNA(adenine34) deaminase